MDLQLASESKRGYTVSPSNTRIIVWVIANCQMSMNPYFQYIMLTKNFLFMSYLQFKKLLINVLTSLTYFRDAIIGLRYFS